MTGLAVTHVRVPIAHWAVTRPDVATARPGRDPRTDGRWAPRLGLQVLALREPWRSQVYRAGFTGWRSTVSSFSSATRRGSLR